MKPKPKQLLRKVQNRTLVFSTTMNHEAQIVKDRLEAEGVHAIILNQQDSMYQSFGYIEVYVLNEEVEKAKSIVKTIRE